MFVNISAQVILPEGIDHLDSPEVAQQFARRLEECLVGFEFWSYHDSHDSAEIITAKVEVVK